MSLSTDVKLQGPAWPCSQGAQEELPPEITTPSGLTGASIECQNQVEENRCWCAFLKKGSQILNMGHGYLYCKEILRFFWFSWLRARYLYIAYYWSFEFEFLLFRGWFNAYLCSQMCFPALLWLVDEQSWWGFIMGHSLSFPAGKEYAYGTTKLCWPHT